MVERVTISHPRLPAGFDGVAIAAVADVHASPLRGGRSRVQRVVELVNSLHADLVCLLGDLVHNARHAPQYVPLLAELEAPHGVWATLGNHEHGFFWYSRYLGGPRGPSADEWRCLYAQAGIRLLVNETTAVERNGSRIWLVGVDDAYSDHADLSAALPPEPDADFRLAITHSPDVLDHPRIAELALTIAGHTHGGQIRLPRLGPLYAPCRRFRERAAGLVNANGTTLYVTRGAGEGFPLRFLCPREISLITLRAHSKA